MLTRNGVLNALPQQLAQDVPRSGEPSCPLLDGLTPLGRSAEEVQEEAALVAAVA
jgi:hypothetical protein